MVTLAGTDTVARPAAHVDDDAERDQGLPLAALLVVAAITAGVANRGGYERLGQWVLTALLGAAFLVALLRDPWRPSDRRFPLVAAGALGGWALVSAASAGRVANALAILALLTGIAVVLLVMRRTSPAQRQAMVVALVAIGALTALSGWVGVAFRLSPWALIDQDLWRAATPITYSNAAAGLLVPLTLVALARLVDRPRSPVDAAAVALLLVGAGATLSRGGGLALALGGATLAVLLGPGVLARTTFAPGVGALITLAGLAPTMPSDRAGQPVLAVLALVAGLAAAAGLVVVPAATRRLVAVASGALALALLSVAGATGALDDVRGPRLSISSPDRADEVGAALDVARENPVTGAGPGRAVLVWDGEGGQTMTARYAHNEYVQVLAELGTVGLALLVGFLAALGLVVHRGRDAAPSRAVWAGVAAGLVAFGAHSALDFLWHVPVLPLVAAVLVGLTTPFARTTDHLPQPDHLRQETA